jgi:hypothetical protein
MRQRLIIGRAILACIMASACLLAARAAEVPTELRDRVAEAMAGDFVRPQTTIYRFDSVRPYSGGDDVVCGAVNYESSEQKYVGFHDFYAMIHDGKVILHQTDDPGVDTSGALRDKLNAICPKP